MELKDFKQHIKELMTAMGRSGVKRLAIKNKDFEIELERETEVDLHQSHRAVIPHEGYYSVTHDGPGKPLPSSLEPIPNEHATPDKLTRSEEEGGDYVVSPMVGTFYASPSPDSAAFVKAGDSINKEQVVCIIEAMKVMNEIKAGIAGTVVEALVSNGDPVEFGTKLFRLK